MKSSVSFVLLTAGTLLAAPPAVRMAPSGSNVAAPVAGYTASRTPVSVQPLVGISGALLRGDALTLPEGTSLAAVSPSHDFGLAASDGADALRLFTLASGEATSLRSIPTAWASADQIVFSPSGSSAVLYSAARHQAQVISGLPGTPSVSPDFPVDEASGFAVSDDAQSLAVFSSASLQWRNAQGALLGQQDAASGSTGQYLPGVNTLLVVDPAAHSLARVALRAGQLTTEPLLTGDADLTAPVALAADTARVWIANADGRVLQWSLTGADRSILDCGCTPASLMRAGSAGSVLLTSEDGGVWFLDARQTTPRLGFVPRFERTAQ